MQDSLYRTIDGDGDTLGGRISLARDALDLSVEDAARVLGVEYDTWLHWENDRSEPRANRLSMLAGVLQVSLSWLLTGHGHGPDWEELTEVPPLAPNRLKRAFPAVRF
jgi:transcriptional regulator with XRE-family HTH domain